MKFGELLKKHRIANKMTLEEVAEETFRSVTDIIEIEEGNLDLVTMGLTSRVATLFRIEPMELLRADDIQEIGIANLGKKQYGG